MKTSIIVPVYNQLPDLLKLIQSLSSYTDFSNTEIILVDDGSKEFNLPELFGAPLRVFRNEQNYGFARTCNIGAKVAEGDILVFLNSDIQVSPNWLPPILELFDNPKIGIVGPKLVFPPQPDGQLLIQSCGGWFDLGKGPFHRYIGWKANDWRVNKVEQVSWTTGAALAIRKVDFVQCGGFDESYIRAYFEDVDLNMKIVYNLGKEVWYTPYSTLMHAVGKSTTVTDIAKANEAAQTFRYNSNLFHARWNDKIVPDVKTIMVNY